MTDSRQTILSAIATQKLQRQAAFEEFQVDHVADMTGLDAMAQVLSDDMKVNPVPASAVPVVVVTPPQFVSIPFVASEFVDVFGAVRAGGAVTYSTTSMQFEPNASASKIPSTTVGTSTPGTASIELEIARTISKPVKDFQVRITAKNVKQLRTSGTGPNAWEVYWLFFNQHKGPDGVDAYNYLACKSTGVELGQGFSIVGQKYLYTSSVVKFPIGVAYSLDLKKVGTQLTLLANGAKVFSETFPDLYDIAGAMSHYSEDCRVLLSQFDLMTIA